MPSTPQTHRAAQPLTLISSLSLPRLWPAQPLAAVGLTLSLACGLALAEPDRAAEKAARRAQQQMQALQQQLQQAQAEKTQLDTERAELAKKLEGREQAAGRTAAAQRAAEARLKLAEGEKQTLLAKVAELEKSLAENKRAGEAALLAKDQLLATAVVQLKRQDTVLVGLQTRLGEQQRLVGDCSLKNDRLTQISAELLDRYRKKGVWEAARQREPLLGLSDVQTFNQVQDYRDKAEAERFVTPVERR